MLYVLLLGISFFATTMGAISGLGGGVIIKPVLDACCTLGVSTISFLSSCTVFCMAVVSLLKSRSTGVKVDMKKSTFLAIGAALGGVFGKNAFEYVKKLFPGDSIVGAAQSGLLVILTILVVILILKQSKIKLYHVENKYLCLLIGLSLGIFAAFIGIGGGNINVAALTYFFAMDAKTRSLNSIYIILFSQGTSLLSTFITNSVPKCNTLFIVLMVIGGIAGGLVGSTIVKKVSNRTVDKLFIMAMFFIILITSYNFVNFLNA